jgi:hypothetical protein
MHRREGVEYTCATHMSHSRLLVFAVALSLCAAGLFAAPAPQRKNAPHPTPVVAPSSPVLLDVMQQELGRAMQSLAKQDPAP